MGVIEGCKVLEKSDDVLAKGRAVNKRIGSGKVNILKSIDEMVDFEKGKFSLWT